MRVKNWRTFQHYKDRNPPWIKLHFSILSSEDWVTLDDASRVLAIACMLIASRNEGVIPSDPAYIKRVAYLNKTPNFKPLIECGFLEPDSDCKQMLADARPETYKEEAEKKTNKGPNGHQHPKVDESPVIETLPLLGGGEFPVKQSLVSELEPLYPAVDIPSTLREMKGWLVLNTDRRKTRAGIRRFIGNWLQTEQAKHGG
jgi:hypothetical protein